jgi:hypothetical protein
MLFLRLSAAVRRLFARLLLVGSLGVLAVSCAGDLATTPLGPPDLSAPTDRLTAARLATLAKDPALCAAVLRASRVPNSPVPPLSAGQCGHSGAVRLRPDGVALRPDSPVLSCPMAAATHLWLREVVQPAAQAHFGARVTGLDHMGSYACRPLYGQPGAALSEHARANALDVGGFRLSNGRRVAVLQHWNGSAQERAFLREVRSGACRLYGTTLSPDYNAAHADHLHLDMAVRGGNLAGGYYR